MQAFLEEAKKELSQYCLRYGVKRLELFGSAAEGVFDGERSDLDFLVEFLPCTASEHYERFFGLAEDLERLLGKRVDLVEITALRNPYFIKTVNATRQHIYAA